MREAGCDVQVGGNIGVPILDLEPPSDDRIHVIECSSFQIDLAPSLAPSIGVLINITPDHIDRHGTMENYAAIKERLVAAADVAVVGVDDAYCHAIGARLAEAGRPRSVSCRCRRSARSIGDSSSRIAASTSASRGIRLTSRADRSLEGAARYAARIMGRTPPPPSRRWECGLDDDEIASGLRSFPGLPHRLEEVGRTSASLFVNDSKATNADAAEKALLSFTDIFWILGGRAKEGGIEPLRPHFSRKRKAYLIGEASEILRARSEGALPFERCGTLEAATPRAARDALGERRAGARRAAVAGLRVV